jgi:hypothetical protein
MTTSNIPYARLGETAACQLTPPVNPKTKNIVNQVKIVEIAEKEKKKKLIQVQAGV